MYGRVGTDKNVDCSSQNKLKLWKQVNQVYRCPLQMFGPFRSDSIKSNYSKDLDYIRWLTPLSDSSDSGRRF